MTSASKGQIFEVVEDIINVRRQTYAKRGERVRLIADFVNVYIVQHEKTGNKFPTQKNKLKAL